MYIYKHTLYIVYVVYIDLLYILAHGLYAGWGFGKSCDEIILLQMRVSFVGLAETEAEAEPDEQLRAVETQEKKK